MKIVFLVRHFLPVTPDNTIGTPMDPPLHPLANQQAAVVAEALSTQQFDSLYTSELVRTRDSAALIAERIKLPSVNIDIRLNELHSVGLWKEITLCDMRLLLNRETRAQVSNQNIIEPDTQLFDRARSFLSDLGVAPFSCSLIVSHYNVIRALVQLINGRTSLDLSESFQCSYGSLTEIHKPEKKNYWVIKQKCIDTHFPIHLKCE